MSAVKFASITAGLLARKGEAKPWAEPDKVSLAWQDAEPVFSTRPVTSPVTRLVRPTSAKPAAQKKCAVRMSAQEYEQLGILAVKKDSSRQQLLREALGQLLSTLARDYPQCPCLKS